MTTTPLSCDSTTFSTNGSYSRVCGHISAFQYGQTDAFQEHNNFRNLQLHQAYLSGVSLTHGDGEAPTRNHIWSFAAGRTEDQNFVIRRRRCLCDNGRPSPDFVGEDYFCESGLSVGVVSNELHSGDPLWDGEGCIDSSTCCSLNNPPYFTKQLSGPTSDDIEARLCCSEEDDDEDIAVILVELYVQ